MAYIRNIKVENTGTIYSIAGAGGFGSVSARSKRWIRFVPSNHRAIKILGGTAIHLNSGKTLSWSEDTIVDFSGQTLNPGTDYFIFTDENQHISISTSNTSDTLTKIGRFHTLCVSAGNINMIVPDYSGSGATTYHLFNYHQDEDPDFYEFYTKSVSARSSQSAYSVLTIPHPLSGYVAGDILPESIFCISFQPDSVYEDGMVYCREINAFVDIYLQSGTGSNTRSKYGATHTTSRTAANHREDMRQVGKRLLWDYEFTSAALGSNERTSITGSRDQGTTGGHVDTSNRRMISAIGCEECCGYLLQWLSDVSPTGSSGWRVTDAHSSFGQEYGEPYVLLAGGCWDDSSSCGSRSRASHILRSRLAAVLGGRGLSLPRP